MQRLSTVEKWYFILSDRGWTEDRSQSCEYVRLDLDFFYLSGLFSPYRDIDVEERSLTCMWIMITTLRACREQLA